MTLNNIQITAVFVQVPEGGYSAYIEEIHGVNTHGETLEETKLNLKEAFELVIESNRIIAHNNQLTNTKSFKEPLVFA